VVMMPRGLAAAILAVNFGPTLVQQLTPGTEGFFADITFLIILRTAIICTIGVTVISYLGKKELLLDEIKKNKKKGEEENNRTFNDYQR
jgi:hypothetical protein